MVVDVNYWTKVIKKILAIILTIVLVYLGFALAVFYMPFLVAFIISLMLEPIIRYIMRKWKLKRKTSSIIIIVVIMSILVGLLIWGISSLINEGSNFLNSINEYFNIANDQLQNIINSIKKLNISESVLQTIESSSKSVLDTVVNFAQNLIKSGLNIISSIPTIGIYFVITLLSLYFICSDKVYMIDQLEHHLPEIWVKKIYKHIKDLVQVLGKYLKAEATLVLISFVIVLVGLYVLKIAGLNIKYPLLYAIGIGFIDALPIFGSGTVMVPWAVGSAFFGDIKLGICILVLWIIISVVRQIIEPKIVGNHIGIHPIFTLIAMYTGFRIIGIIGLFVGPIILIILKNIFESKLDKGVIKTIFSREIN